MTRKGWIAIAAWLGLGLICLIGTYAHAEQPIRLVVTLNCDDIRAIAQWEGWEELERRARAAGQSEAQLDRAKSCLR
jgi:hypothetical protein